VKANSYENAPVARSAACVPTGTQEIDLARAWFAKSKAEPLPRRAGWAGLILAASLAACGLKTPVQPTPPGVSVSGVSPSSGPTIGGTSVSIIGAHFSSGAGVTIGGTPATNVTLVDSSTLSATTGARVAGTGDVLVVSDGRSAVLPGGFTYIDVQNTPPSIVSLTAQGSRPNQPALFADLNEEINVVSSVTDAETAADQLTYQWTADAGTFAGSGPSVKWRAPQTIDRTPATIPLKLTVIERFQTFDEHAESGGVVDRENTVSRSVTVRLHNSRKEAGDRALEFLTDFSNSAVPPETAVRSFSDSCPGKAAELQDVRQNRANHIITASRLGSPAVTFGFGGVCFDRIRPPGHPADACMVVSCGWTSTRRSTGVQEISNGSCYLTAVYESSRWRLCDSDFEGSVTINGRVVPGLRFPFLIGATT